MTPRELIDKLCQIHGVANPNQLAPLVGIPAADLYSWRNKHAPSYANTMKLLAAAGVLNFEAPRPPATAPALEAQVQALREELLELRRLVEDQPRHLLAPR